MSLERGPEDWPSQVSGTRLDLRGEPLWASREAVSLILGHTGWVTRSVLERICGCQKG